MDHPGSGRSGDARVLRSRPPLAAGEPRAPARALRRECAVIADRPVFRPLTIDRWDDLVDLFGPERGACAGCWCMWPRIRGVEFKALSRAARRARFRRLVALGPAPGLLAYERDTAVGWVAVSPRRAVHRFNIARKSAPTTPDEDLDRTWAITCFYVRASHRGRGLTRALADAAIAYARRNKARRIDVCAVEPEKRLGWGDAFVGVASSLRPLGFTEIARRTPRRPLLRIEL
ncbi:MAG: GNAT family N-acetyltransferase [Alphaproteobacteria bacterium]|nr:GNAT family N-acetyltransferase [Alphaproteobacteria bacterium]